VDGFSLARAGRARGAGCPGRSDTAFAVRGKIPLGHAPWPSIGRSGNSSNLKRPVYSWRTTHRHPHKCWSPPASRWGFFLVRPLTEFGPKTDGTYVVKFSHGRRRVASDLNAEGRGGGDPAYRRGRSILVVEPTDHLPQAHFLPIV
jgi:hypothetical protein